MAQHLNYERAAAILVDAAYLGDEAAAKKWNVTTRTVENYRARLKTDPKLSVLFAQKRAAAEGNWVSELRRGLMATMRKATMIVECIGQRDVERDAGVAQGVGEKGKRTPTSIPTEWKRAAECSKCDKVNGSEIEARTRPSKGL